MLKSKIHRAKVTEANLNYVDSNLLPYEKLQIVDIDNGQRFETYIIPEEENKGDICLNGAAARCVKKGDKVIIMSYCTLTYSEAMEYSPVVLF